MTHSVFGMASGAVIMSGMNPVAFVRRLYDRFRSARSLRRLLASAERRGAYNPDSECPPIFLIPGEQIFRVNVTYTHGGVAGTREIKLCCDRRTPHAAMVAYAIRIVASSLPANAALSVSGVPTEIRVP